jgi:hypothetical protein
MYTGYFEHRKRSPAQPAARIVGRRWFKKQRPYGTMILKLSQAGVWFASVSG